MIPKVSKSLNMNSKFYNMQMPLPSMKLPNSFSLVSGLVLTIEEPKVIKVGA